MDLLDRLALAGRRYERRRSAVTGSTELSLEEVLRMFKDKTVLELDSVPSDRHASRVLHETGRPVSILDGVAAITGPDDRWYEVMQTPPSGDLARLRIAAMPSGGHLSCLIGRRLPEHHVTEDPLLEELRARV